jgi:putative ABC transport system permease protein
VLGASLYGIVFLFIKEFIAIIAVAAVIACPLTVLLMRQWLSDYAYRIDMTAQPFVLSILLLLFVTGVLIVIQTIKAALANPMKALRSEGVVSGK